MLTVHDVGGVDPRAVRRHGAGRWLADVALDPEAAPRPDWRRILDVYLQVGRGLSAAHQLGVVHRDVKPENILVARNGRVLIGDFGLAGLAEAGETSIDAAGMPSGLTQTGSVLGTPAYMAPEQHEGRPADMLSDQFSFCVSLYESLHGRRPFPGRPAPRSRRPCARGRITPGADGVPRAVDRVVARGLAAHPAARHASMDALLGSLARAGNHPSLKPVPIAGAIGVVVAATAVAAVLDAPGAAAAGDRGERTHRRAGGTAPSPPAGEPRSDRCARLRSAGDVGHTPGHPPRRPGRDAAAKSAAAARALAWARRHPEIDARLLLDFADGAHADRDGGGCLNALNQIPADAWPRGAGRARAAPARDLRDAPGPVRQGAAAARAPRRRERQPRPLCSRTARSHRYRPSRIASSRGQRAGRRRALRGQQAGAARGAEAGAPAADRVARDPGLLPQPARGARLRAPARGAGARLPGAGGVVPRRARLRRTAPRWT